MSDPELLWARLLSFHDAGFLLAASVGGSDEGEAAAADAMGLLTEHAYSLLRVVNVFDLCLLSRHDASVIYQSSPRTTVYCVADNLCEHVLDPKGKACYENNLP